MILTFDIGTSALKTALIADDGRMAALHTVEYTPSTPLPDRSEMDPEAYIRACAAGSRNVLERAGVGADSVDAIGLSSQGQTFVCLDRVGKPIGPAIVWLDRRAADLVREWEEGFISPDSFFRSTGYPWLPPELTVFKAAWLARNAPWFGDIWKLLCLPEFLVHWMTGEALTDRVTAQFSGLYDLRTGRWNLSFLDAAGLREDQLAAVGEPGTIAGWLREDSARDLGLRPGIPVCLGANDQIAGALGAGNCRHGDTTETTGTALAVVTSTTGLHSDCRMMAGRHAIPGLFFAMPFANTAAAVLKWLRDLISPGEDYNSFLRDVGRVPPGCDGLTLLPHFSGAASPDLRPDARGIIAGLTLLHGREHLARAAMESCACQLRQCVEVTSSVSGPVSLVRSLGGAARSGLWLQMKADMLGIPVERPACSEAASLGAGMMAAKATGRFGTLEEAADSWYRPDRVFEPDSRTAEAMDEVYGRFQELYEHYYGRAALASPSGPC